MKKITYIVCVACLLVGSGCGEKVLQKTSQLADESSIAHESPQFSQNAKMFRESCAVGNSVDCYKLGVMYAKGDGKAKWYSKAAQFYKIACR